MSATAKLLVTPAERMRVLSRAFATLFLSAFPSFSSLSGSNLLSTSPFLSFLPNNCSLSGSANAPIGITATKSPIDFTFIPSTTLNIACESSCTINAITKPTHAHSGINSFNPGKSSTLRGSFNFVGAGCSVNVK